MATRSGKTYQEPKRSRRRNVITETSATTTPNGKYTDNNLDVSSISNRDLRARRSSMKNSTFDKSDVSVTKTSIDNATESNWIVSDLSSKVYRRQSNVNTSSNESITSDTPGNTEKKLESKFNTSNISTKQLRKTNSHNPDSTFDKSDEIVNVTYEKETEKDKTCQKDVEITIAMEVRKAKEVITYDKDKTVEQSRVDLNKDTENDLNSLNVGKTLKQKKKKSKGSKKKKQKGKLKKNIEETHDNVEILNATFEKDNNEKDSSISKNVGPNNSETNTQKNMALSSSKILRSRQSSIKDNTFEKDDKLMDTTYEKDEKISIDLSGENLTLTTDKKNKSNDTFEIDTSTTSDTLKKRLKHRKSSIRDVSLNKSNTSMHSLSKEIFEKDNYEKEISISNKTNTQKNMDLNSSNISNKISRSRQSSLKNSTFDKEDKLMDTTYEKDEKIDKTLDKDSDSIDVSGENFKRKKSSLALTSNKNDKSNDTFEIDTSTISDTLKKSQKNRKSNIRDVSLNKSITSMQSLSKEIFEKDKSILSSPATKRMSLRRQTMEIIHSSTQNLDITFDKESKLEIESERKSRRLSEVPAVDELNITFDKEDIKDNCQNSKSSLISSDNSSISRISITSDESTENIVNTIPLLIESSMDETQVKESPKQSQKEVPPPLTPLKREGTFTKEAPDVELPQTPGKRESAVMPAAGCTPYHVSKSSQKKPMLNVTRSIEKRLSVDLGQRMTRVMFCSPIDNPTNVAQEKRKIIKSNLKGSNKSFIFDENSSMIRSARKRSYTQNDADDARTKRTRLAEDLQQSVDRLSRPRTPTTTSKQGDTTPKKSNTPYKSKSETKPARTRLPNFAILHQKQFDKMESLGECQERKAKRAKQMLTPSAPKNLLDRISPKNNTDSQKTSTKEVAKLKDPSKKPLTLESLRPGFTRFGFKLNLDFNPFSIPSKADQTKDKLNGIIPKPSLTGATAKLREPLDRREAAKQTVMREKSIVEKRKVNRSENRTFIKGVRTNRRFELQMKLRSID